MPSDFSAQGAASGAAAGSAAGPWGALAGGVIGGFVGGGTPSPAYTGPPIAIGGQYSPYGSISQDPNTGAVYQFGTQAGYSPTELYNQALMSALMGQQTTGPGSQEAQAYSDARNNILAQIQQADKSVHDQASLAQANSIKDRLQGELQQLDAAHGNAAQTTANNPMLQFLSQGKYNTMSDVINQNANNQLLQQNQALANRGLAGSTLSDMNSRQAGLQRGTALQEALQGVGQQDLTTRMALMQGLMGQNQSINQQRLSNDQMGLGYGQMGAGLAQNFANAEMGQNATNAGITNASNWAGYNAGQRGLGDFASVMAAHPWSSGGGQNYGGTSTGAQSYFGGSPYSGSTMSGYGYSPTTPYGSYGAGGMSGYGYSPSTPYGSSYNYNPNSQFSTSMSAAGGK